MADDWKYSLEVCVRRGEMLLDANAHLLGDWRTTLAGAARLDVADITCCPVGILLGSFTEIEKLVKINGHPLGAEEAHFFGLCGYSRPEHTKYVNELWLACCERL